MTSPSSAGGGAPYISYTIALAAFYISYLLRGTCESRLMGLTTNC